MPPALWGFGRSRRRWDGALGEQDWVAATGSKALEDGWTSGKGVEALAGGCLLCRFLGRLHDAAMHARRRQASEKRQGTKSR